MVSNVFKWKTQLDAATAWKLDIPALHVVLLLLWHQILVVLNASEKRLKNLAQNLLSTQLSLVCQETGSWV
jgi:hypothetical protein